MVFFVVLEVRRVGVFCQGFWLMVCVVSWKIEGLYTECLDAPDLLEWSKRGPAPDSLILVVRHPHARLAGTSVSILPEYVL